jgi:hypothetical protein
MGLPEEGLGSETSPDTKLVIRNFGGGAPAAPCTELPWADSVGGTPVGYNGDYAWMPTSGVSGVYFASDETAPGEVYSPLVIMAIGTPFRDH